ncbi:MAG: hypothetical protein Q9159_007566 [Coniocarpon cinnabarinum]
MSMSHDRIEAHPPALQPTNVSVIPSVTSPSAFSPAGENLGPLSKTYVIPPRPKPGRKPATDTPQTKRKEQNREAQRAFRERRAARVGELEEELAAQTKAWTEKEANLQRTLREQQYQYEGRLEALQSRLRELEHALSFERRRRAQAESELQSLRKNANRHSMSSMTSYGSGDSTPWSHRAGSPARQEKSQAPASQSLPSSRTDAGRQPVNSDAFDPSCRRCESGGSCACLEQRLAEVTTFKISSESSEPMEIDFTTLNASRNPNNPVAATPVGCTPHDAGTAGEPCGFCTDSQNCVCKTYNEPMRPIKLPKIQGPGTCEKCQADPERATFCKMLAQAPPLTSPAASASSSRNASHLRLPSIDEKMAMSCDQAYDTLSKEPAFKDRKHSLSFITQLKARPASPARRNTDNPISLANQSALEVDIAGVLAAMRAERNEEIERKR